MRIAADALEGDDRPLLFESLGAWHNLLPQNVDTLDATFPLAAHVLESVLHRYKAFSSNDFYPAWSLSAVLGSLHLFYQGVTRIVKPGPFLRDIVIILRNYPYETALTRRALACCGQVLSTQFTFTHITAEEVLQVLFYIYNRFHMSLYLVRLFCWRARCMRPTTRTCRWRSSLLMPLSSSREAMCWTRFLSC